MSDGAIIETRGLGKTFRSYRKEAGLKASLKGLVKRDWFEKEALRDVSVRVGRGEIVGLIGANGAGKTTLVKCLAGIIHASRGEARVLGFNPAERPYAFRRQISLIMGQKAQLWWDLPASDCFVLLRDIYGTPKARFRANLAFLADTLGVHGQLNVPIRRLSLGERMKMELIAALLHDPKVVFLDEPTIGLDLNAQRAIRQFLLAYREQHAPAMLLTSHYMEDIEALCERIVVIREGSVIYDGSLREVVTRYGQFKTLTLVMDETAAFPDVEAPDEEWLARAFGIPAGDAVVSARGEGRLVVQVARDRISPVASRLLERLPVRDLSIAEDDIAHVIAAMMDRGRA